MIKIKLQLNGKTFQVSLPKSLIVALEWKQGDRLKALVREQGCITLKKE